MANVGDRVGRYELVAKLGEGGMGAVYRALDTQLHRSVALKVLLVAPSEGGTSGQLVARMLREARAAAAFNHANAVAIYDVGEVDGLPFLVMELVAGQNLRAYVDDPSIAWQRKVGWLVQAARALGAAHRAGLVHRDIKPDNVMIRGEDDAAKVLDFGIARATAAVDVDSATATPGLGTLTAQGAVVGTPLYMAPEQVKHEPVDGRTDQFAWGVMAYELLSGSTPWGAKDVYSLVAAILDAQPAPLEEERCPGLPADVAATVHRTLQKKPDDRFPSMDAVADALAPFVERGDSKPVDVRPSGAAVVVGTPEVQATVATTALESVKSTPPPVVKARTRRVPMVLGVAAAALLAGGGTMLAKWVRGPHIAYCVEMNPSRTGPRCGIPLTEEQATHLEDARRVTTVRGHVVRIENANTVARPWWDSDRDDVIEYVYEGDRLAYVVARERHGRLLRRCNYSGDMSRATCTEADGVTPRSIDKLNVTEIRYAYDANGFVSQERFFGRTGKPRATSGRYGLQRDRRPDGMTTRLTTLGADGLPAARDSGACVTTYDRDARGYASRESYFACDGTAATLKWHHTLIWERDAYGADIGEYYLDASGHPTTQSDGASYHARKTRDEHGHVTSRVWLGADGQPHTRKTDAFAATMYRYDDKRRPSEEHFLDAANNPVMLVGGTSIQKWVWDEHNDLREERSLDESGRPVVNAVGLSVRKTDYDDRGRVVRQSSFNTLGQPFPWKDGAPVAEGKFDDRDLIIEIRDLDSELHPVADRTGVARTRVQYNAFRRKIRVSFTGAKDEPVLNDEGCAAFTYAFDADDNLVEDACIGVNGAPLLQDAEHAFRRWKYDENGLPIEEATYDTNRNLVLGKNGYAVVRQARDRSGDIVESSYFGKREEPLLRRGGYARQTIIYDIRRRKTETALFDTANAPVVGSDGWSIERITYDERSLVLRTAHLDASGKPVLDRKGSAAVTKTYDDRGNVLSETTEGIDGAPIITAEGYAIKKSKYDERDLLVDEALLDAGGKPIVAKHGWATRHLRYDAVGNQVEEAFLDADHRPVVPTDPSYASTQSKFDVRRRLVESSYFDATGAPMKGPDGVEVTRYERDAYGHATETRYLDSTGASAASKDGKQVIKATYDSAGRLTEELFADASGAPKPAKDGCAGHRTKYDDRGHKIEEDCLNAEHAPGLSVDGWAIRRTQYDARGNAVDESTYGPNGALIADKTGVAKQRSRYDERSLKQETSFFDASEKPAHDTRGISVTRYRYDDTGKSIEETYFDEAGKPVHLKEAAKKP